MKKLILAAAVALSFSNAFANTGFTNGSFESANIQGQGNYSYSFQGVQSDNWVFSGGAGIAVGPYNGPWAAVAADGNNVAFLQNSSSVSQTFSGFAGQYTINFQLAQRTNYGDVGAQSVNVLFNGQALQASALQPTGAGGWQSYSFTANAGTSGSQTLTFQGTYAGWDSTVFVDKVSVSAPVAAVPEPESYAMLLAGLGLMGGIARRRTHAK